MPNVFLQTSDDVKFTVDVELIKKSITISSVLDVCKSDEDHEKLIPLPNVNSVTLNKVLQWLKYHKNRPDNNDDKNWTTAYFKIADHLTFDLAYAANYLDISDLLDACCKRMSVMILECGTPDKVRKRFLEGGKKVETKKFVPEQKKTRNRGWEK